MSDKPNLKKPCPQCGGTNIGYLFEQAKYRQIAETAGAVARQTTGKKIGLKCDDCGYEMPYCKLLDI